jgi:hypothetical protein
VKWNSSDLLALAALALGIGILSLERATLADAHHRITQKHDVYLLPPKHQAVAWSLGYRAATADLIFGHVLVSAGIHLSEKRYFEFAAPYLETVNELDPKFRDPYRYSDALITLQTVPVPEEAFRQARHILLRGTRELPFDQQLWAAAGQFLAYLAPPRLSNPAEQAAFRQEGARLMARACELIGSNENIPYHCITATKFFTDAGNRAASIALFQRLLVVSDDPEIRAMANANLAVMGEQAHTSRFEKVWREDLPFVPHNTMATLGPRFDPAECAGKRGARGDACATSFRERFSTENDAP